MNGPISTKQKPMDSPTNRSKRRLRWFFEGERGLRTGWSALLFVAIALTLEAAVASFQKQFVSSELPNPIPLHFAFIQETSQVLIVVAATFVMARIERKNLLFYGYLGPHKLRRFTAGAVWGVTTLSAMIATLYKAKAITFDPVQASSANVWTAGVGWAFLFLLVGIFEESLLRGYLQFTLSRGIGFWWSACVLSVVFALIHVGNGGESLSGLVELALSGLFFCVSLWCTGSLWWAVGFHAGWDWAESFLYGTPNSGLLMRDHLFASRPVGDLRLSGGASGPEASLLMLPLYTTILVGMWIWWGRRRSALPDPLGIEKQWN